MTAHVLAVAIDEHRMATFSPVIVDRMLKQELGFTGVVVSDDLGMKAVSETTPLPDAAVAAVMAGCDALLLCNSTVDEQVAALEALIRAAERREIPMARFDDALKRQHAVKARLMLGAAVPDVPLNVVGCTEHHLVATEMATWR